MTNDRAIRAWPPVVAAIAAALLVFLVLPNPLSVPRNDPSASAEYAPVPGDRTDADAANFSETAEATSGGIGAGGKGPGPLPGRQRPTQPVYKAGDKECVGNPPRQTEDPLSPPCVATFTGPNGGDTFQGVTKDAITIVFYNDRCCDGDLNSPWKPSDESSCGTATWECENIVRTVKAQLRYFNDRFQTYGRQVRLIAQRSSGNVGGSCASRQADAGFAYRRYKPFAVVWIAQGNANCYAEEMAKRQVPIMGLNEDLPEKVYRDFRPYSYGFMPSQEVQGAWSATFICQVLDGRRARFANDPTIRSQQRSFGLIKPESAEQRDSERVQMAEILQRGVEDCGTEWAQVRTYNGSEDFQTILSSFKQRDITTVVCQCVLGRDVAPRTATGLAYFPEWFWDQATYMDRGIWMRTDGAAEQAAFGTTYFWRLPAFRQQYHYQAYLSIEPQSQPNVFFNYRVYHLFLNLFEAIQAAGPDLTPESVETGMFTFRYLDQSNPWVPMGGYGPYDERAISSYTFVDTGMAWRWDPTGTPPGGNNGEGCMRVPNNGIRAYPGAWPRGDAWLLSEENAPCSQDAYKIVDPSSTDLA